MQHSLLQKSYDITYLIIIPPKPFPPTQPSNSPFPSLTPSTQSKRSLPRHILLPLHHRLLIRPIQQRIVISTFMLTTPARTGVRFSFERGVGGAHEGLPDVVEAVGRVVGYFFGKGGGGAVEGGLEVGY